MKQQPNGMRPEEIDKVLAAYGYISARQKGSHKHYLARCFAGIKQENPLKLPKSLHQRLAIEAEKEGVSLNQLALYKLAL